MEAKAGCTLIANRRPRVTKTTTGTRGPVIPPPKPHPTRTSSERPLKTFKNPKGPKGPKGFIGWVHKAFKDAHRTVWANMEGPQNALIIFN